MSLSLGIDIGTSGVRTAVLDDAGEVVAMARADHLDQNPDRIDADKWWQAARNCIASQLDALETLGHEGQSIRAISVDGTSGSMVLTDADLTPATRALMYNSKGFSAEAQRIHDCAPDSHITRGSNSALARALRLVSEDADGRACHLLHQSDFISAKLMGRAGYTDHNNALKTGFDPETGTWPAWIDRLMDPSLLPSPKPVGSPLGTVSADVAADLDLSPETQVRAGTTDSIAAFLAVAPLRSGVAVSSLGSTLAVKLLGESRIDDPSIGLYSHRLGDMWLAGGASNTGGAVLSEYFTPDDLTRLSAMIDPDVPTGLDYYPLRSPGERFPINDPDLPPRLSPRPESDVRFLHGMLEGIARIEARCYSKIAARGGTYPTVVYSAGGGARNPVFSRIRSQALGLVPLQSDADEAAIGAARIAAGAI